MKNRVLVLCSIGLLAVSASSMAAERKNTTKVGFGFDQGFGITGQLNDINAFIGNDGLSADYLFKQGRYEADLPFTWYVGGGAYYNWDSSDNLGLRLPLGLTLPFAKQWEVYGQVAPELDYNLQHNDLKFQVGVAVGIRYAF